MHYARPEKRVLLWRLAACLCLLLTVVSCTRPRTARLREMAEVADDDPQRLTLYTYARCAETGETNAEEPLVVELRERIERIAGASITSWCQHVSPTNRLGLSSFYGNLEQALSSKAPPDLVLTPEGGRYYFPSGQPPRSMEEELNTQVGDAELIERGLFLPIGGLLRTHAPALYRHFDPAFWKSLEVDGELYGIPTLLPRAEQSLWVIDRLQRIAVAAPVVTDFDSLFDLLSRLMSRDVQTCSYVADRNVTMASFLHAALSMQYGIRAVPIETGGAIRNEPTLLFYVIGEQATVHTLVDRFDTGIKRLLLHVRKLGSLGFFDQWADAGKAGCVVSTPQYALRLSEDEWAVAHIRTDPFYFDTFRSSALMASLADLLDGTRKREIFDPSTLSDSYSIEGKPRRFLYVPTSSPNAGRTLGIMDRLFCQETFDLLHYGVRNVHWTERQETQYLPVPNLPDQFAACLGRVPVIPLPFDSGFSRIHHGLHPALKADVGRYQLRRADTRPDLLSGFRFDTSRIADVYAPIATKLEQTMHSLYAGTLSLTDEWEQFGAEYGDDVNTIRAELQRQLDRRFEQTGGNRTESSSRR